jgi:DNA-binding response OmpR family regulator
MQRKILLVEDKALIAMKETATLEKHGFDVETAYSTIRIFPSFLWISTWVRE